MSITLKSIQEITSSDLRDKTIASLSDRPNQTSRFTQGLTAQDLKERFDAFPEVVKEKINSIIKILSSPDASKYIRMPRVDEELSLYDFLSLFGKKSENETSIADYIYAKYYTQGEDSESGKNTNNIQAIFDQIEFQIWDLYARIQQIEQGGGGTTPTPPDDGEDGGGTTPTPPDDGEDGGGTTPTPPDDGEDGGGTTPTPPDDGEDDELTGITEEVEYYANEATVPNDVLTTARVLCFGAPSTFSTNFCDSSAPKITINPGNDPYKHYLNVQNNTWYHFWIDISGYTGDAPPVEITFVHGTATSLETHNYESSFSSNRWQIECDVLVPSGSGNFRYEIKNVTDSDVILEQVYLSNSDHTAENKNSFGAFGSVKSFTFGGSVLSLAKDLSTIDEFSFNQQSDLTGNSNFANGFGDYINVFDIENQKIVVKSEVVLSNNLTWTQYLSTSGNRYYYYYAKLPKKCINHKVLCAPLTSRTFNGGNDDVGIDVVTNNGVSYVIISLGHSAYGGVQAFTKKSFAISYALAEPRDEAVNTSLDGYINVVPGGKIRFGANAAKKVKFKVRYVKEQ